MLIKRSDINFPMVVHVVRNADGRQDVERKVLALSTRNLGMTVDPACANASRNVWNQPAATLNKVVTHSEIESKIMVLDSAKNRFQHSTHVKLVVATEPAIAPYNSPTNARRQELRTDFVTGRWINRAK